MVSANQSRWLAAIYAATIFTSAFLLFQIQPMISKAILPWFGGTPAVWTTCLLFFQSLLFAGYAYAHFSNTWLTRRQQAILHAVVLIAAVLLIRVLPTSSQQPRPEADPTWAILTILAVTIGLPYFVLSATGPLLQAWFAETFPGRTPYRLYALSNIGSLLALVSYPFVFEGLFDLPGQGRWWTFGFVIFGALCAFVAWRVWASSDQGRESNSTVASQVGVTPADVSSPAGVAAAPRPLHYLLWLALPAFASVMLMATTNHVSTDVAVVPLLWVVPLALYLLTFIFAFDHPGWYRPTLVAAVTLVAIYLTCTIHKNHFTDGRIDLYDCGVTGKVAKAVAEYFQAPTDAKQGFVPHFPVGFRTALAANFVAMFGVCFLCHGELARLKPAPRYLTGYYLMMSAGGALGGVAVSVIAPHVFDTILEWTLAVFAGAIISIGLILYALVGRAVAVYEDPARQRAAFTSIIALLLLLVPTSLVLLDLVEYLYTPKRNIVFQERNFFGTLTIRDEDADDPKKNNLVLLNGTTIHGSQYKSEERRALPTSYYATTSGIGRVLNFFRAHRPPGGVRIADVGLGTGTLAAYVTKGDFLTFYEINPAVVEMSTSGRWFTYVPDCRARGAKCDIKLGDARLTLERETKEPNLPRYHVIVLDAFSSDAVPTHLLTIEAYDTYLKRLASEAVDGAEGALIVHVSNRYLDLSRVVMATAAKIKFDCVEIHNVSDPEHMINGSDWMILTRNQELLAALAPHAEPKSDQDPVLWTDARSSLFEIVKK